MAKMDYVTAATCSWSEIEFLEFNNILPADSQKKFILSMERVTEEYSKLLGTKKSFYVDTQWHIFARIRSCSSKNRSAAVIRQIL